MESRLIRTNLFNKNIALPSDHGSWVFLISPLLIGLFAGRVFNAASVWLIILFLATFLLRQPVTILVKVLSGRRGRHELQPALFWLSTYGLIALIALIQLVVNHYTTILWVALPGLVVFGWHLYLVSKRSERHQIGVEILGSGVLALVAPCAYWLGIRQPNLTGWILFALCWLQSAGSIVYAYLRLTQRRLDRVPSVPERFRLARRALLYTTFNVLAALFLALGKWVPVLIPIPFAVQWLESIYGTLVPAVGYKPTRIGFRQLAVSVTFTILFILVWI